MQLGAGVPGNDPGMLSQPQPSDAGGEGAVSSVFVGDLSPEISDVLLMDAFRQFYPSVTSAKVAESRFFGGPRLPRFLRLGGCRAAQRQDAR